MITDIYEEKRESQRIKDLNDWINNNPSLPMPMDEIYDKDNGL